MDRENLQHKGLINNHAPHWRFIPYLSRRHVVGFGSRIDHLKKQSCSYLSSDTVFFDVEIFNEIFPYLMKYFKTQCCYACLVCFCPIGPWHRFSDVKYM